MNDAARMRAGSLAAGVLLFAGASLAFSGTAAASPSDPADLPEEREQVDGPPGDNGTVKIHDPDTPPEDMRNEPHVCTFTVVGSGFDAEQQVWWKIRTWPPGDGTKERPVALEGELALDGDGHGETAVHELPDGHYKLFWNFEGENGKAKQKVFWVDCEADEAEESEKEAPEEPETPGEGGEDGRTPDASAPDEEPEGQSPEQEGDDRNPPAEEGDGEDAAPEQEDGEAAPAAGGDSSDGGSTGGLPVTGAALGGLLAAGAVAAGGGATAMVLARKRKAAAAPGEGARE